MGSRSQHSPLAMVESAFLASATGIIFLINYYFPLGPFLRMFFPIPIALAYLRRGRRTAIMTAIVAGLLLSVLMGPTRSIQFLIPYGLCGLVLGFLWTRRAPWAISIPAGTVVGSFGTAFQIGLLSVLLGENVWLYLTVQLTNVVGWIARLFGMFDEPELWLVQAFAIAGIVLSNFAYQILVHLVAWILLDRLGNRIPPAPPWLESLLL